MNFTKQKRRLTAFNRLFFITLFSMLFVVFFVRCGAEEYKPATAEKNQEETEEVPQDTTSNEELDTTQFDTSKIYIPMELRGSDMSKSSSRWYYGRSKQSEHFIVFWDEQYGDSDPNSAEVPSAMRVDVDDLLEKAEGFYTVNINELKFAETGVGKSNLDNYKMMIFIIYQDEWLATGAGYDDVIGALWVNPATCHPVGSTIAHEIGHSFQYQVYCDLGGTHGYRYGFGGNGGNAFWEQCAQWQSFQSYPQEAFTSYNFSVYTENYFRHICHEWQRYASYWIHYYWADKYGREMIGRLWREAEEPEDPIETYMRLTNISVDELNDELYDAATKFVTWDLDAIRDLGHDFIGAQTYKCKQLDDGSYQVAYERCPGTTGYNVIRLNVPDGGTIVSAGFTGTVNAAGFNTVADPSRAGWRYGYVALLNSGERVYSEMFSDKEGTATFTVPANCSKLWFVVSAAPTTYLPHAWDEDESNDDQWPYTVKFEKTDIFGNISFDGTETPADVTLNFDVAFPVSATDYIGTTADVDLNKLAKAFVLQPSDITGNMDSKIKFYAVESDNTLNATTTANGYGHWFDADGNVIAWGDNAMVFSEYDAVNFVFTLGQYPGHCASGDNYTIKQALVYEVEPGNTVQATFVFNITIQ